MIITQERLESLIDGSPDPEFDVVDDYEEYSVGYGFFKMWLILKRTGEDQLYGVTYEYSNDSGFSGKCDRPLKKMWSRQITKTVYEEAK